MCNTLITDNTLAIVLGSVGAVLALVVMVIAIVVYTKKQKSEYKCVFVAQMCCSFV